MVVYRVWPSVGLTYLLTLDNFSSKWLPEDSMHRKHTSPVSLILSSLLGSLTGMEASPLISSAPHGNRHREIQELILNAC